jgi:glycosyltransferase involved in cell wall biosynthesis
MWAHMTAAGEPLVTVLTPFYNTAQYLSTCIESVLNQSYRHLDYVLVDNLSTDGSWAIATSYAKQDSRIRVIRADRFRAQIDNYNFALQHASPDAQYVKYAQADDFLYPTCIGELVAVAERHPNVGVVSSYDLRGTHVYRPRIPVERNVFTGREVARLYFLEWVFPFGSQTTVLFRSNVIDSRRPFFPDVLHPDTEAVFGVLRERDFGFVHDVLSFVRMQDDSVSARRRDLADSALDRLIITKRFGQHFLNPSEYAACLRDTEQWYYRELGRQWIRGRTTARERDREFWSYQQVGLSSIGDEIDWKRVRRSAAMIVRDNLINPMRLWRRYNDSGPHTDQPRKDSLVLLSAGDKSAGPVPGVTGLNHTARQKG